MQVLRAHNINHYFGDKPTSDDASAHEMGRTAAREGRIEPGARNWAIAQHQWNQSPVYLFMHSRVQPFNDQIVIADHPEAIGAYHTSYVPY
jgi:hypothetical protein